MLVGVARLPVRVMVFMPVVIAPLWRLRQLALEEGSDELIDRRSGIAGANFDAIFGEKVEGSLSHTPGDDDPDALLVEPAGQ